MSNKNQKNNRNNGWPKMDEDDVDDFLDELKKQIQFSETMKSLNEFSFPQIREHDPYKTDPDILFQPRKIPVVLENMKSVESFDEHYELENFDKVLSHRYIGIPGIGAIKMAEETFDSLLGKTAPHPQRIVEKYLSEAEYLSEGLKENPAFSIDKKDLSVEDNYKGEGPTWSQDEDETFIFVLKVEEKKDTKNLLYGNDPNFLIWAGITYVYSNFDENKFYDDLFKTLTL